MKYDVVFFEDLDRLNNAEIFVKLRELNILLNNDEAIKKPVKFVYAVRDDIFSDKDRTKFFELSALLYFRHYSEKAEFGFFRKASMQPWNAWHVGWIPRQPIWSWQIPRGRKIRYAWLFHLP